MKRNNRYLILLSAVVITLAGCDNFLDTRIDTFTTPDRVETRYNTLWAFANAFYAPLQSGFNIMDNNLFASASDEAQQTAAVSNAAIFNKGTINANINPLTSLYSNYYEGIRAAHFFLDYAKDGEEFLALNRDTSGIANIENRINYEKDVRSLNWYRAEAKVAMAYYYSELIKMYGGVPLVTTTMDKDPNKGAIPRSSYDDVVTHIVGLIDSQLDHLQVDWATHPDNVASRAGRFDKATALAIKARTLLYAASPRNNPANDKDKWAKAAQAAHDLIVFKNYTMPANRDYSAYFSGTGALNNPESIYLIRKTASNSLEKANYPISTPGGNSGVTPTENLVSVYEYVGPADPSNPYFNRDPRLAATVVTNGSKWNNRIIDQSPGGSDDMSKANTSRTGYYLKKFMIDNLNLTQDGTAQHLWIMYRYAEVLLNYAEAMNEAYGPDAKPSGFTLSARQALTQVRNSASTSLATITTTDPNEFRNAVKRERQVELAFEDHRYWDLIRWKNADTVLNKPVRGVRVSKNMNDVFVYQVVDVASRTFMQRNYYLPFSRAEVVNSNGTLVQNDDY
ncbi:RagB/SusD family nutrient uptake outer membrane protein [Bacteroides sp. 51]|uniref:RagB/SusD family nutrient uptake outer membrane protein n=1 Tax=Bacteroides sp. 51 TaxID=2302938 RepID=UPI0013D33F5F|nr:RagB/SusD family nutrient uptake outer membrane protein [Bacteroides sp. 51]NDV82487.1 RagB/SusD family nutrient uptake outer membrane protein [Bacteroides sp. 51]